MKKALMLAMLVVAAAGAWAQSPVRLVYAEPCQTSGGGMSWYYTDYYVHVDTGGIGVYIPYIHYQTSAGQPWQDAAMSLLGNYGTHSLYYVRIQDASLRAAVKCNWFYAVSGMSFWATYWDNNEGADYRTCAWGSDPGTVAGDVGGHVGLQVCSNYVSSSTFRWNGRAFPLFWNTVSGNIVVENLSFAKNVGIRLTKDNWATFQDIPATYAYNMWVAGSANVEVWKFNKKVSLLGLGSSFEFAVYYTDQATGITYWDNNFEQNYQVSAGGVVK
ncbi:MAG: CBM21 domain-containing protein [Verrucomicrobia bacterium]|nr:CBM21 domain-containing protein [Verrucomicrobiota bacterium]MBU1910372.1 CBM21 domain-containing protein [Verrucomicrobiota bacterium]